MTPGSHVHENPDPIVIRDKDGRLMLAMRADGSWEIGPEDAPEAARIFAEQVSKLLPEHPPLVARLEAAERERDAANGSAKDWEGAHRGANILKRKWRARAEAAEARLEAVTRERYAVQTENERLRAALERIEKDELYPDAIAAAALAARTEEQA